MTNTSIPIEIYTDGSSHTQKLIGAWAAIIYYNKTKIIIKQKNKFGLININGDLVKEPIYDNIQLRKEFIVFERKNFKDEYYSYEN